MLQADAAIQTSDDGVVAPADDEDAGEDNDGYDDDDDALGC